MNFVPLLLIKSHAQFLERLSFWSIILDRPTKREEMYKRFLHIYKKKISNVYFTWYVTTRFPCTYIIIHTGSFLMKNNLRNIGLFVLMWQTGPALCFNLQIFVNSQFESGSWLNAMVLVKSWFFLTLWIGLYDSSLNFTSCNFLDGKRKCKLFCFKRKLFCN